MDVSLISVYNKIGSVTPIVDPITPPAEIPITENLLPMAFVYMDYKQLFDQVSFNIIETYPILGEAGAYIYKVENEEYESILSDREINMSYKYLATINNTYTQLQITEHRDRPPEIPDDDPAYILDGYDYIKIENVPTVARPVVDGGADEAITISVVLISAVELKTEPFDFSAVSTKKNFIMEGHSIIITISTKYDNNRETLGSIQNIIIKYVMEHHRKFDIFIDGIQKNISEKPIGYFKLAGLPVTSGYVNNGETLQQIQIILNGYTTVSY